jgi:hypothetical protein
MKGVLALMPAELGNGDINSKIQQRWGDSEGRETQASERVSEG